MNNERNPFFRAIMHTGRVEMNNQAGCFDLIYTAPNGKEILAGRVSYGVPPDEIEQAKKRVWSEALKPFNNGKDPFEEESRIILPEDLRD